LHVALQVPLFSLITPSEASQSDALPLRGKAGSRRDPSQSPGSRRGGCPVLTRQTCWPSATTKPSQSGWRRMQGFGDAVLSGRKRSNASWTGSCDPLQCRWLRRPVVFDDRPLQLAASHAKERRRRQGRSSQGLSGCVLVSGHLCGTLQQPGRAVGSPDQPITNSTTASSRAPALPRRSRRRDLPNRRLIC
jgi:hypothetical protein